MMKAQTSAVLPSEMREFVQQMNRSYFSVAEQHFATESPAARALFHALTTGRQLTHATNDLDANDIDESASLYQQIFLTDYQAVSGLAPASATDIVRAGADW